MRPGVSRLGLVQMRRVLIASTVPLVATACGIASDRDARAYNGCLARKGVHVRVRCCETVGECLQESHDLAFLLIRQTEVAERHVDVDRMLIRSRPKSTRFGDDF